MSGKPRSGLKMREEGVEPSHLSVLEPKSSASASSATHALMTIIYRTIEDFANPNLHGFCIIYRATHSEKLLGSLKSSSGQSL